jgi:hypothetical protein
MADAAANTAPEKTDAIAHLYGRKGATTGDGFVKYPANQFAHAVGFSASDKGKTPYIDANGDYTNLAAGASTAIKYVNSSGIPAWTAAGTDGYSLLLQAGVPVWANNPSSVRLLLTQTASGATSIDFTTGFDSTYDAYMFVLVNVYPSTDATSILMRVSEDAGSSFIATGYETVTIATGTADGTASNSATSIQLTLAAESSNVAAEAASGTIHLIVSTTKAATVHSIQYRNEAGNTRHASGGSAVATTSRANGVRFLASSGNINGKIHMYGVKNV